MTLVRRKVSASCLKTGGGSGRRQCLVGGLSLQGCFSALQRREHHVPVREAHGRNMIAQAIRRLAVRPSKDPLGEVWRAEALQIQSEPGDMRGGFGSLAQQGFPARFPGRAPGAGETCPGDKGPRSQPLSTSERPSTTRCRRSDCCARRAQLAFLCGYGVCQMPHTNQIYT